MITHITSLPSGVSNKDSELDDEELEVVLTLVVPEDPVGLQEIYIPSFF